MTNFSDSLSRAKIEQKSINSKINIDKIINIFFKNKVALDVFIKKNENIHIKKFWLDFFKNKKFSFPINKHCEIYIKHHKHDTKHIFNYINFRYLFYLCGYKKIDIGFPPHLLIEAVSTCNLRCPFCFQTDKTFTKKPYMGTIDFDLFKKVIDEANLLGVGAITIASRGEPTLHKNLKIMLKYLETKKNIFEIKLNTNATLLTEELSHEIFKNKVTQVVISADHYEKESFEKLRKNSNFEKVVNNVDMLFRIRKQYKNSITEIRVSGINFYKNLDQNKFYDFWIKRCDHVSLSDAFERWDTYNNLEHPKINDPCEILWDRMYVWFDGKVNPCDFDYKSYLSYGNVKENSIKEIWENNIIAKTRQNHLNGKRRNINPCNKCGVTYIK